jgi:hypothetical protein
MGRPIRAHAKEGTSVVAAQGEAGTCSVAERRPAVDQTGSELWTAALLPPGLSAPIPAMNLPFLMQGNMLRLP